MIVDFENSHIISCQVVHMCLYNIKNKENYHVGMQGMFGGWSPLG